MSYLEVQNMIGSESFKLGVLCGLAVVGGFCFINMIIDLVVYTGNRVYKTLWKLRYEFKRNKALKEYSGFDISDCANCANCYCDSDGLVCGCGHILFLGACEHFETR